MKHVILDLETLSTDSNAAIISIGACIVDNDTLTIDENTFYKEINIESSMDSGGVVDASTIKWWMGQSEKAKLAFKGDASLAGGLISFETWIKDIHDDFLLWGCGVDFDNVILLNSYKRCKIDPPWNFWNNRCFRTLKSLYPDILYPVDVSHNSLEDAIREAHHFIKIMEVHNANSKI